MWIRLGAPVFAVTLLGCAQVLGLDEFTNASGGAGAGLVGGSGGEGASTSTTMSVGGSGGSGGSQSCVANTETRGCYGGPPGTEDVGLCKAGTQTCGPDGTWPAECPDDVLPRVEDGQTSEDEDCVLNVGEYTAGALLRAYSDGAAAEPDLHAIAALPGGEIVVAGHLVGGSLNLGGSTVTGDDDPGGFFWGRLRATGDAVWTRSLGITGVSGYGKFVGPFVFGVAGSVGVDLGNGTVVPSGTPVVAKYDLTTGAFIYSLTGVAFQRAATFGDRFCGTVAVGTGLELRCYFDNGVGLQLVLTKALGSSVRVNAIWMNDANVVLAGELLATTTFGNKTLTVAATSDAFVTMVSSSSGMFRSSEQLGVASGTGAFTHVDVDGGSLVVGGSFTGMLSDGTVPVSGPGAVLSRFAFQNSGFTASWTKAAGFPRAIGALSVDALGNAVAAFELTSFTDFGGGDVGTNGANFAWAAFDAAGSHLWSRTTDVIIGGLDAFDAHVFATGVYFDGGPAVDGATPFGAGTPFPLVHPGVFVAKLERIPF